MAMGDGGYDGTPTQVVGEWWCKQAKYTEYRRPPRLWDGFSEIKEDRKRTGKES
jgi:hypothetical protein